MIPLQSRETSRYLRSVLSLVITISLGWWNISGTLSAQENLLTQFPALSADSLSLSALESDIGQAELEVIQTNLLHRLIPQIQLSGSIGIRDIFFIDPSNMLLSYIPKDAYRLSITLSVTDIFDGSGHRRAELELERLRAELSRQRLLSRNGQAELHRELASLEFIAGIDSAALSMKEEVLRFEEIRFAHGKIEYDDLVRVRLELLSAKKNFHQLNRRMDEIRRKLGSVR